MRRMAQFSLSLPLRLHTGKSLGLATAKKSTHRILPPKTANKRRDAQDVSQKTPGHPTVHNKENVAKFLGEHTALSIHHTLSIQLKVVLAPYRQRVVCSGTRPTTDRRSLRTILGSIRSHSRVFFSLLAHFAWSSSNETAGTRFWRASTNVHKCRTHYPARKRPQICYTSPLLELGLALQSPAADTEFTPQTAAEQVKTPCGILGRP